MRGLFLLVEGVGVLVDGGDVEAAALVCSKLAAMARTDFFFFTCLISIESDMIPKDLDW